MSAIVSTSLNNCEAKTPTTVKYFFIKTEAKFEQLRKHIKHLFPFKLLHFFFVLCQKHICFKLNLNFHLFSSGVDICEQLDQADIQGMLSRNGEKNCYEDIGKWWYAGFLFVKKPCPLYRIYLCYPSEKTWEWCAPYES